LDLSKFFAITHEPHVFLNPIGAPAVDALIEVLALPPGAAIVDIACGKAELLVRTARRWGCAGVGVDLNPFFVDSARRNVEGAGLEASIQVLEGNGAEFAGKPEGFDLASCMGASWIWGGYAGMLDALVGWARPGGLVLAGEPFWRREPAAEHLAATGLRASSFAPSHHANVQIGIERGLRLLDATVATEYEWDRYHGLQWGAAERYASANAEDPDAVELVSKLRELQDQYLRWGRDEIGWALYLFRTPSTTR
jgi:precorrin-6B methylase 2